MPAAVLRSWWLRRAWSPSRSPPTCRQTSRRGRAGRSGWCRSSCRGRPGRRAPTPAGCAQRPAALVADGGLDGRAGLAGPLHERHAGPRAGRGGTAGADGAGGGAHRRPGCGKSYSVRAIVALARAKRAKVVLAAPTGQAAKRLSELAGLGTPPCNCCSCAQVATPPLTATIPWTPIWWWWMRPRCWMCCWPTSWSRPSHRGAPAAGRRRGPAAQRRGRRGAP